MSDETRIFINPLAIEYDTVNGRPLRYHRHWRHLDLELDEYLLRRSLGSMERDIGGSQDPDDDRLIDAAYEDYEKMSHKDQERLEGIQLRMVGATMQREAWHLSGWARIVGRREIRVFSVGRKGKPQGSYDAHFRRVKVGIRAAGDEDRIGGLFLTRPDERSRMHDDETEDHVQLHVDVRAEVLEKLADTIRTTGKAPALKLYVDALLYQSEVDASFSEPYHDQQFAMIDEGHAPAALSHMWFDQAARTPEKDTGDDSGSDLDVPTVVAAIAAPASELAIARQIGRLTFAVWGLAAAVVVAALLTA